MSNRNMNLDVIVRMKDMLSSPLRRLTAGLRSLGNVARSIGIVGTAIAAISFMGPIKEAAAFQQQLLDIAATQNLSGQAAFDFVDVAKRQYEDLALSVAQTSADIAASAGQMIAAGVNEDLVDASIGTIGRSATASGAAMADMANVATSLLQTLKLPADQLEDALGGLVVAGKEGAFELKDMARYFPTLTSQMAKFGVTGREAVNFLGAALQIARKGTSDPAEAANNLKNFLSKVLSPQTIKNFAKAGVDIEAVMRDAAVKGINPVEAVMQKIVKLSGVSGTEIEKLMQSAKANGLEGAEALGYVREQLEKIHGAGALGDLFQDVQVMDFLIPFLGNVEEYKRIKEEVAKATAGLIDEDFETKMKGLTAQLIIFKEIGTQAAREVGFAFGSWLPMISDNLKSALIWMRELDDSTGGMVRQALSFAGAAVLVATGLGVLGVVLPIVGAGFAALLALASPVGLVLAGIAAGAVYIYKNWETYGPRLSRLWDRAKRGFFDLADGMRERAKSIIAAGRQWVDRYGPIIRKGFSDAWEWTKTKLRNVAQAIGKITPQIVAAGQELVDRYGPVIKQGFSSAWEDVKAGAKGLETFFEGFLKGLDFNVDLSGLTIDDAKLATFRALDGLLKGIKAGWDALKDFGSGFATYLGQIGDNLGSTINSIGRIASAFGRLGTAIVRLTGLDSGKLDGIFTWLGKFAGEVVTKATEILKAFAGAVAWTVEGIADIAEAVEAGIDWKALLPDWVAGGWEKLASAINSVKNALSGVTAQPGDMLPNGTTAGSSKDGSDREAAQDDWLNGPPKLPFKTKTLLPANNNMLPPRGALDGESKANVSVTIKVDGPGKVTSTASDNKAVKVGNTGRVVGRN